MNLTALVLIATTLFLLYLFAAWRSDGWYNLTVKILCGILTVANALAALYQLGWMVRIPG